MSLDYNTVILNVFARFPGDPPRVLDRILLTAMGEMSRGMSFDNDVTPSGQMDQALSFVDNELTPLVSGLQASMGEYRTNVNGLSVPVESFTSLMGRSWQYFTGDITRSNDLFLDQLFLGMEEQFVTGPNEQTQIDAIITYLATLEATLAGLRAAMAQYQADLNGA